MKIITSVPTTAPAPLAGTPTPFRPGAARPAGLMDLPGVGYFSIADTLTGYGRTTGYESLANARRAAFQLSVGAESPAAGVYHVGERFFVRALGAVVAKDPHAGDKPHVEGQSALTLLHFEGNTKAHFAWVNDPRLVLVVDGATKVWSRDAHHQPPAGS